MHHHAEHNHGESRNNGIEHHRADVELQALLRPGADARHADEDQFEELARQHGVEDAEPAYQLQHESRDAVVRLNGQVHDQLDDEKNVYGAAEQVVHLLLFPCLFRSHGF